MLNLKKTALAVLALGSSAVFAGTMGPVCTPSNVTVPCEKSAWSFAGQGLYLEPTYSGDFAYGVPATTEGFVSYDNNRNWDWGFKLEAAYMYGTGNDLNLNWYHFKKDRRNSYIYSDFNTGAALEAIGSFRPQWDQVNLEFGQLVNFGETKSIRFHGGFNYSRIEHNYNTVIADAFAGNLETKYDGFGPRIGADMNYDWGNGLGIYANAASSILIGKGKFYEYGYTPVGAVAGNVPVFGRRDNIVPEVEAKLGARYTYAMPQGDLALDGGYMWVNYFDVQHVIDADAVLHETNFALNGPFVGLRWTGNV